MVLAVASVMAIAVAPVGAQQPPAPVLGEARSISGPPGGPPPPPVDAPTQRGWLNTASRAAVLTAYHATFGPAVPAHGWTGNIGACQAGTLAADHRANALSRVNWYRAMAGVLDGVIEEASFTSDAQQAALMVAANNQLSHNPPSTWACYTAAGANGADRSNLYLGLSGPLSVDGFVEDPGANNAPVGHRAWILERNQVRMGFGSVPAAPQAAALYVIDPTHLFGAELPVREASGFVSWPPRGFVPSTKVYPRWSLQRDGANFTAATVQVTVGGQAVPTTVEHRGSTPIGNKPASTFTFVPTLPPFPSGADLEVSVSVTGIAGAGQPTSYSWTTVVIPPDQPPQTPAPADFTGDGSTDRSVFRPSTSTWFVHGGQTTAFGVAGDLAVPCDYDGDGTTEVAVFRPASGGWFVDGQPAVFFGSDGDIPVPADYDGDGACEVAVYRPAVGGWYRMGAAPVFLGVTGDVPVPGDYDGSGAAGPAVYRPSVGGWYAQGSPTEYFGTPTDIPVPGDYSGGGATEVAVFRPSVGGWYRSGAAPSFLGSSGDIPAPGDYDGNGMIDVAVFRPPSGTWFVSGQGPVAFGAPGDQPLPLPSPIYRAYFAP